MTSAVLTLLVTSLASSGPQTPEACFQAALQQWQQGQRSEELFYQAAIGFEKQWRDSPTPAIADNLARSYFLAGDLPRALAAFRCGLDHFPADPMLQAGLSYCREQVNYPTANNPSERMQPDPPSGLRHRISLANLLFISLLGSVLYFVGVLLNAINGSPRARVLSHVGCALFMLALFTSLFREVSHNSPPPTLVLLQDAELRLGNGESYPPVLATWLPRGAEVIERHRRGGWVQIALSGGLVGWLPERVVWKAVEPVQSPQ